MRAIDLNLAQLVARIWRGKAAAPAGCCALLAPEREYFAGEDGLKRYRTKAEADFASVEARHVYRL